MNKSWRNWRRRIAIAILAAPLLEMSCVEISQRAIINGLFDATEPIVLVRLEQQIADFFANWDA